MFVMHPVKVIVEDLLPAPKVQGALGYGNHSLSSHDGSFEMAVGILFQVFVMLVLVMEILRGKFFQSHLKIFVQAAFDCIDEDTRGYVHCIH
jgi:hypothetical protein